MPGGTMRAVRVVRHGRPTEAIEVHEIEAPVPDAGSVAIRTGAASLNFGDLARCTGGVASVVAQPPFTLGMDCCGVVETVGDEAAAAAAGVAVGDRVVACTTMSLGGLAGVATAALATTFPAPPGLDDAEAASLLLPAHLSVLALHRRARLRAGETLVVLAAGSGVGTALVQVGVAAGATVIAVAGGSRRLESCRALGAHHVVDHRTEDLFDRVLDVTGGRGADVLCDLVGGEGTEAAWAVMAREGRYLPLGFNDDEQGGLSGRPLRKVATGNFDVLGVVLAYLDLPVDFRRFGLNPWPPAEGREVHRQVMALVEAGDLRPVVGRRITLDEVAPALEDHAARTTTGRTVAEIGS